MEIHAKYDRARENHDEPTADHMGIRKITRPIGRVYYWPEMFRQIAIYVRGCKSYHIYKASQQRPAEKMLVNLLNEA